MKNIYIIQHSLRALILCALFAACNKDDLLNAKPKTNLAIPASLADFQALLDVPSFMNETPGLGEQSTDNYYMTYSFWQTMAVKDQNAYLWAPDIFQGVGNIPDWNRPYLQVLNANIVLEGLARLPVNVSNQQAWDNMQGAALFYRAYALWNLAQIFCKNYDASTAGNDPGIPLRLSSDVNSVSIRASVQQTYAQIILDVSNAKNLLATAIPINNPNRPSRPAALALLARIYLSMGIYDKAGLYADSCLQLYNTLIDYNTVPTSTVFYAPFQNINAETFFQSNVASSIQIYLYLHGLSNQISVDSSLYRSYTNNDLRKTIFYYINANGNIGTNETYYRSRSPFTGFATDEMYLMRAECNARAGNMSSAMADLNALLIKRWKSGTFIPYIATSAADALKQILAERRKELPFRGVRWMDLRRLNKEGYNIILTRILNGQTYTLAPGDPKYVLPIPPDVIQLSGISQNPR